MANVLKETEIEDLILTYQSELAKLEFRASEVKSVLDDLRQHLAGMKKKAMPIARKPRTAKVAVVKPVQEAPVAKPEKKIIAPKKIAAKKTKAKPVRKSAPKAAGYKLSSWDELVIESIKKSKKALRTKEITELVLKGATKSGLSDNADLASNKVIRSLQKLANRRNDLTKVNFPGKGFIYAMPAWVDADGKLKDSFK